MAKITLLAENNCVASPIAGSVDAYSIANLWWFYMKNDSSRPLFETEVVSIDGRPVTTNGGITWTAANSGLTPRSQSRMLHITLGASCKVFFVRGIL